MYMKKLLTMLLLVLVGMTAQAQQKVLIQGTAPVEVKTVYFLGDPISERSALDSTSCVDGKWRYEKELPADRNVLAVIADGDQNNPQSWVFLMIDGVPSTADLSAGTVTGSTISCLNPCATVCATWWRNASAAN